MATRIRLQRKGKKKKALYHVVIADQRAPRDGKFIEKLGIYNPNTNPATIDINFEKTLDWLMKGAQPSDTVRAILSYKGLLMKKHLLEGVRKGAFSEEEANKRFETWIIEKNKKVSTKIDNLSKEKQVRDKQRLEAEKAISDKRELEIKEKIKQVSGESEETSTEEKSSEETASEEKNTEETVTEEKTSEETASEEKNTDETTSEENSKNSNSEK